MQPNASLSVVVAAAAVCALLMLGASGPGVAAAPHPCDPDNLMVASGELREMCAALYKLSSAMQVYLNDRAYELPVIKRQVDYDLPSIKKKQEVDHYFLRFGRRR